MSYTKRFVDEVIDRFPQGWDNVEEITNDLTSNPVCAAFALLCWDARRMHDESFDINDGENPGYWYYDPLWNFADNHHELPDLLFAILETVRTWKMPEPTVCLAGNPTIGDLPCDDDDYTVCGGTHLDGTTCTAGETI